MNKAKLIDELAARAGLPQSRAREVVEALFDPDTGLISGELQSGGSLSLHGFGRFGVRSYPARKGRNPRTGKEIEIAARTACTFQPRKGLRSSMKDMVGA